MLDYWDADDTFRASIARRDGAPEYVFYDGPPFANGLPHYGHLLTGYVKDIVPRYRTMRGYKVERRFGWDTHGLPAELEVRAPAGHHRQVARSTSMGIAAFNDACRASVLRYTDEWQAYVTRQARWVDFDNDYKTLDLSYMESVIWAFKQLWDKGLAYEGYRVLPYCWRDETPLSNHELRMDDDVYQSRQDPALTVGFKVAGRCQLDGCLPAGLDDHAVDAAVQPGRRRQPGGDLCAGAGRRSARSCWRRRGWRPTRASSAKNPRCSATYSRRRPAGHRYLPPFPYFMDSPNAFQVLPGDFVTTEDGTGSCTWRRPTAKTTWSTTEPAGIVPVTPVDAKGRFDATVPDYQGQHVFDANPQIIRDLKNQQRPRGGERRGAAAPRNLRAPLPALLALPQPADLPGGVVVVRHGHRVPRPDGGTEPADHLVSRARQGRPVRQVAAGRPRLVDLAKPLLGHARFRCGSPTIRPTLGSMSTAASTSWSATSGCGPTNLHRPYIDELTRPNPDDPTGRSTMRRIPDVLDVWFDSGSMPYAQVHYPFENQEWFDAHYPSDFIVEYIGQTRGWFYTLHVLATALFDRPAFKTCVAHGIVLGSDGQKMSKSLRNYPDVNEVFDRDGSDAMRWFLMASPILRGGNLIVTEQGIRDGVAPGAAAAVERLQLPAPVRAESRCLAHRFEERAGPLHPGQAGGAA